MPPSNLYDICVRKTSDFLINGVWERCEENPFSSMPSSIVQDLLAVILRHGQLGRSHLLLSSNMLEYVDLFNVKFIGNCIFLFQMLSRGCQNLRRLSLPNYGSITCNWAVRENLRRLSLPNYGSITCDWEVREGEQALQELLRNCGKLEELHSNIYFDPNYLRKCRNLRRLKLHLIDDALIDFFRLITPDLLQCLPSLETFSFLYPIPYSTIINKSITSAIVTILENCPNLTSMGFLDSSTAIKEFHERDWIITPRRFQLRRCYWVTGIFMDQSVYSDLIRLAALSCPLLQVLVMNVHYASSLQYLKVLKDLTFLDIKLHCSAEEYEPELYSLLSEIGRQLQFLSVIRSGKRSFDANMILSSCPNLRALKLNCDITAGKTVRPSVKLRHLKSLKVFSCDGNGLFCLLSNCLNLKLLRVEVCKSLNDELLLEILEKNNFAELEGAYIFWCSLTKLGITKFLKTAGKLRKFSSSTLYSSAVLRYVRKLNPSVSCHVPPDYLEPEEKYSFRTCWL